MGRKIVCYIDAMDRIGGAQRVMFNLAEYLALKGYSVIMVNEFILKGRDEYDFPKSIKRYILDNDNDGKIKKNINRVRQLRKIIKTEHPELVLSFMGRQNYRMYLASYGIDVKKIISVRNDPKIEYGRGIKKIIANKVFESMDGCVFQTHEAQKYFTPKLVAKSKVIINGLGDIFYEQKYNPDAKNIVSIGRLESQKNFKMLIDAFGEIEELFPEEKKNMLIYSSCISTP